MGGNASRPRPQQQKDTDTYYSILGVLQEAAREEIESAYRKLARTNHPDRNSSLTPEQLTSFKDMTLARATLCDPVTRMEYDLEQELIPLNNYTVTKLLQLTGEQADACIRNMEEQYQAVCEEESPSGLIILKATYGVMRFCSSWREMAEDCSGPLVIDVKVPLQCQVIDGNLKLSERSKSVLDGFYNPIANRGFAKDAKLHIEVVYMFDEQLHRVLEDDTNKLYLPKRSHLVPPQTYEVDRISQDCKRQKEARKRAVRRYVRGGVAILAIAGVTLFGIKVGRKQIGKFIKTGNLRRLSVA
eukprot:992906_1